MYRTTKNNHSLSIIGITNRFYLMIYKKYLVTIGIITVIILIAWFGYSIFYPSFERLDENLLCIADPFREFKIFCIDFDTYQHMKLR